MPSNTEWNENEIKLIEFMRKNPQYISPMYNNWSKPDLDKMWSTLSTSLNIPKHECRQKWYNIKNKYTSILTKKHKPIKTKYLDGKLSFLDKYILNTNIKTGSHVEPDTDKATDSDEDSGEEDFVTIDLKMIEDLLVLRGEPQKDNEISKMDNILSVVSKRIDEALSSYIHLANKSLNKPESLLGVQISKSNEVTWDVEVQDNLNLPCKSNYTEINEMVSTNSPSHENMNDAAHDVPSTSMAKNRCRTSLLVKERPDKDDMETIFDIHQSSDSESFYLKLEKYIKRFSVVKQEEIRLKICYLITELEMEED
ncbi:uncharacterized protein LOC128671446 [Plodia interpunctella]|uniref:uncharacterized protein LOC128671446 n=1 Tax=Plodia interpunctella TaxID=58824 RepID=UPI002367B621|nr:uncharacterized protein LOC128671446 [Plodia interpunctella]